MYEGFFGLKKRPFSAVPNTDSFVALEPTQEVLDDLLICLVQSRGIAVVTSFAGLGKTLLCKQVAESADNRFQTVYLSTSAFSTRRALLQAILYEFGIHYEGLSEQEARLKILEAARAIAKEGRLLLIIVDEAHLLNSRLFEELRTLSDYAPEGEALVRLILSGQFELEEKLADPAMSAVHQRIG
ncbi:MAG: AAA family ATPase, partial [Planctomicrobium sp.]|nr:AAA family ATPase [Planctomicrobium sp.]